MLSLWSGLAAGGLHAVSGPDHLAALGPLALRTPHRALRVGASWGMGHGAGLLLLVFLVYGARLALPLHAFAWLAELFVGVLLVGLGAAGLRSRHAAHPHAPRESAAFGVGMLHGATGAGHIAGMLPGLGLGETQALVYLSSYVLAAAFAMCVFGLLLGNVARRSNPPLLDRLRLGCSVLALAVGVLWIAQGLLAA